MTAHRTYRRGGGGIQACWRRRPAIRGAIGGDWVDAFYLDDGRLAVTIGDAAGHDAQAAALAGVLRAVMRRWLAAGAQVDAVIGLTLAEVADLGDMGELYATAFVAIVDPRSGRLTYANAGHPAPLVLPGDRSEPRTRSAELVATGPIISDLFAGMHIWSSRELTLQAGNQVLLYTDGVTEARDGEGRQFGLERLAAYRSAAATPDLLVNSVFADVDAHAGGRELDDCAVAVLTRSRLPLAILG